MSPFSPDRAESIARHGEKGLLGLIREWLGESAPQSPAGMGDDCAVLPASPAPARLITTDSVVLERHFTASTPPHLVGRKLLARSLSDIAAMGGTPTEAVLAGLLPARTRINWLRDCIRGIAETATAYGVSIVGGDLAESSSDLALNLTLLGTGSTFLLRSGGICGDLIGVTGPIGGSLKNGRHLSFVPRLREGRLLASLPGVHACIDVSDGLAIDLLNLLPADASAFLDPGALPLHPDALEAATASGRPALAHGLNDGEDHELLFLTAPEAWDALLEAFQKAGFAPPHRIGSLHPRAPAPILNSTTGETFPHTSGYDHFT